MLKHVNGKSFIIAKETGYYHGWPSIARTETGSLIVAFSGRRSQHVCPYGQTLLVRSDDEGETWSEPDVVNNTVLDDRDAGIIVLQDGSWLISWFTSVAFKEWQTRLRASYGDGEVDHWQEHINAVTPRVAAAWRDSWTRRSTDQGRTWEPLARGKASSPHGPIQLSDGRLLWVGGGEPEEQATIGVMESTDQGRSWSLWAEIPIAPSTQRCWYTEPHAVETQDGRVVCLFRFQIRPQENGAGSPFRDDFMLQTESSDGGRTWQPFHQTPLQCHPPHLIRLHNGHLLCVYSGRYPPYGQRGCLSKDGGQTWEIDNEFLIRDDALNSDLGYPASVQLPDGQIYTVYYQVDQAGEKPCIMGTRWQLPAS